VTLSQQLERRLSGRVVVVGVGNPIYGDDAAGCLVAQRLQETPGLRVFDAEDIPESMLVQIVAARPAVLVFVDAVDLGAEPGAVALLEKHQIAAYSPTTHRTPLSLLMQLVENECGADAFLLAIQPGEVRFGQPLSAEVEASVNLLSEIIQQAKHAAGSSTHASPEVGETAP
jgi:hydrogenase 3 maturation protease